MKYLSIVLLVLAGFTVSCEQSDREKVLGNWKYYRLSKNGVTYLSEDPEEAQRIIDKHVSQNIEYMKNVAKFRDNAEKEMDIQLSVFIEIKDDSTFIISDERMGAPIQESWNWTINEEKKELVIKSEGRTVNYKYKLYDDKLSLTSDGVKVVLKRAEKKINSPNNK